jgi:hypothetical protein
MTAEKLVVDILSHSIRLLQAGWSFDLELIRRSPSERVFHPLASHPWYPADTPPERALATVAACYNVPLEDVQNLACGLLGEAGRPYALGREIIGMITGLAVG